MKKSDRELIYNKYDGHCAYSGTLLEADWQIDHIRPVVRNWYDKGIMTHKEADCMDNMVPVQRLINHYKHSYSLYDFRTWLLGGLHKRLKKVPKNPRTERGAKKKAYILKIASYFDITENKPFSGIFYFEDIKNK